MIALLPCYSLEDFSIYRTAQESNQIFAAWSALYHPALIEFIGKMPSWDRAGNPSPDKSRKLIVIPPCCEAQVPREWIQTSEEAGTVIVRHHETRDEIVAAALDAFGLSADSFPADDVQTFYSLGFCHFVSELFSRKLRYMSNLDTQKFGEKTLAAVKALREGEEKSFIENIRRSFEILTESKEYFFPTAMKLLDLTWLDRDSLSDGLAEMLRRRASRGETTSLVLPTFYLELLQSENPETFDLLKEEIRIGRVILIGGDLDESPLYLLPTMEVASRLVEGLVCYHDAFGVRPEIFGRCGAGYSVILPQLLHLVGCENALLFTRDGWRPNREGQSRIHWRESHRTSIETLSRNPQNGSDGKTFMELPDRIGYSAGSDRVLSTVFEHLPNREQAWLGDIFRMNRFAPVLGEALDMATFFKETKRLGVSKEFGKDEFRTNYLTRAGRDRRPNPVSSWSKFYRLRLKMDSLSAVTLFAGLLSSDRRIDTLPNFSSLSQSADVLEKLESNLTDLLFFPTSLALDTAEEEKKDRIAAEIETAQAALVKKIDEDWAQGTSLLEERLNSDFARLLYDQLVVDRTETDDSMNRNRVNEDTPPKSPETASSERGVFLMNPSPLSQRVPLDLSVIETPETAPLLSSKTVEDRTRTTVDLPPFSALWLQTKAEGAADSLSVNARSERPATVCPQTAAGMSAKKKGFLGRFVEIIRGESVSEDSGKMIDFRKERYTDGRSESFYVIRNRHFEIKIDADTGETRSVRTFGSPELNARRGILSQPGMGNRLAWQVALRLSAEDRKKDNRPEDSGRDGYSIMAADRIEILENGPFTARLRVTGSLFTPDGERAGGFEEILSVGRDRRIMDVELTFRPESLPTDGPWENYFGVRFAWNDTLAELRVGCHETLWETDRDYLQAPELVDIRSEEKIGVTIFSHGHPFYRRYGLKRMDAVLIPKNESARTFHFGIGIDLVDPLSAGLRHLSPQPILLTGVPRPDADLYRFLEVDADAAAVLLLDPVYEWSLAAEPSEGGPSSKHPIPPTENRQRNRSESELPKEPVFSVEEGDPTVAKAEEGTELPLAGFHLTLQETAGKKGKATVKVFWPVDSVVEIDLLHQKKGAVEMRDAHSFTVELTPHQILPLEIVIHR